MEKQTMEQVEVVVEGNKVKLTKTFEVDSIIRNYTEEGSVGIPIIGNIQAVKNLMLNSIKQNIKDDEKVRNFTEEYAIYCLLEKLGFQQYPLTLVDDKEIKGMREGMDIKLKVIE